MDDRELDLKISQLPKKLKFERSGLDEADLESAIPRIVSDWGELAKEIDIWINDEKTREVIIS